MRNAITAVITLATFSLLSGEASAKFAQLQKHDAAAIKSRCDSVGGKFSSTYFSYRCKTSTGTVKCNTISHNCKGYCDKCGTRATRNSVFKTFLHRLARPNALSTWAGGFCAWVIAYPGKTTSWPGGHRTL